MRRQGCKPHLRRREHSNGRARRRRWGAFHRGRPGSVALRLDLLDPREIIRHREAGHGEIGQPDVSRDGQPQLRRQSAPILAQLTISVVTRDRDGDIRVASRSGFGDGCFWELDLQRRRPPAPATFAQRLDRPTSLVASERRCRPEAVISHVERGCSRGRLGRAQELDQLPQRRGVNLLARHVCEDVVAIVLFVLLPHRVPEGCDSATGRAILQVRY